MKADKLQVTVHTDPTDSNMGFWYQGDSEKPFGDFLLVASDDGGYIGVHFTKASWEKLKQQIDSLIETCEIV